MAGLVHGLRRGWLSLGGRPDLQQLRSLSFSRPCRCCPGSVAMRRAGAGSEQRGRDQLGIARPRLPALRPSLPRDGTSPLCSNSLVSLVSPSRRRLGIGLTMMHGEQPVRCLVRRTAVCHARQCDVPRRPCEAAGRGPQRFATCRRHGRTPRSPFTSTGPALSGAEPPRLTAYRGGVAGAVKGIASVAGRPYEQSPVRSRNRAFRVPLRRAGWTHPEWDLSL